MGCIYSALNTVNNKRYVGKSVQGLQLRRRCHELDAQKGSPLIFHRALSKYGFDAFVWDVVFESEDNFELVDAEIHFIKLLETKMPNGYNMTDGGEGIPGMAHSEETKLKMSKASLGRPKSSEHKANLSRAVMGTKRSPFTAETIAKMSAAQMGKRLSAVAKEKIRKSLTGRTLDDLHGENAESVRAKLRKSKVLSPESRLSKSEKLKALWRTSEYLAKMSKRRGAGRPKKHPSV